MRLFFKIEQQSIISPLDKNGIETSRYINADDRLVPEEMMGHNLFAYCNNNPVNMSDPTGHVGQSIHDYYYGKGFYCVKDHGEWAVFANRKTGATETWGKKESKDKSKGGGVYGIGLGISAGLGIYGSAQEFLVWDDEGNVAIAYTTGVGGGVGASIGGGIIIFPSDKMTVFDLDGTGVAAGISFTPVGIEYQGVGSQKHGVGIPAGAPIGKIGAQLYGTVTFTNLQIIRRANQGCSW